ncbi:MAG: hypothetical protein JSS49_06265 [Planctomycetes bacterium]|nr:hypothetical protein [Planctomycetota bacterium]
MAVIEMNWRPSHRDLRVFAVVQMIVAATGAWWLHKHWGWDLPAAGLMGVSVALLALGMFQPGRLQPLFVVWMLAAFPIGWVMSHLLLAIVYYGVVTPIGLLLRLSGRDTLQQQSRSNTDTFWIARPAPPESSRYFRQF